MKTDLAFQILRAPYGHSFKTIHQAAIAYAEGSESRRGSKAITLFEGCLTNGTFGAHSLYAWFLQEKERIEDAIRELKTKPDDLGG